MDRQGLDALLVFLALLGHGKHDEGQSDAKNHTLVNTHRDSWMGMAKFSGSQER
jgi:hypothetical protein